MNNKEVYEHFEKLHSYSFSTIGNGYPEIRIAHFLTYDDEGLYFQTMKVKPFYRQLKENGTVAICALIAADGAVTHNEDGLSDFPPGYFIRVNGDVRELSFRELTKKADKDKRFIPLIKDIERYPAMSTFVLNKFKGEIFDYDFERKSRDNKIERERFSFNGMESEKAGFTIDKDICISCGKCAQVCTFRAIDDSDGYSVIGNRCDECGSCYIVCPVEAVRAKVSMAEADRKESGKKLMDYIRSKNL